MTSQDALQLTPEFFPAGTFIDLVAFAKTVDQDNHDCPAEHECDVQPEIPWRCDRPANHPMPHVEVAIVRGPKVAGIDDDHEYLLPVAIWSD